FRSKQAAQGFMLFEQSVSLYSSDVDLRAPGAAPTLSMWVLSRVSSGDVVVSAGLVGVPSCADEAALKPSDPNALRGRHADWTLVTFPLAGVAPCDGESLVGHVVRIHVAVRSVTGQGVRIDGVTVRGGEAQIAPESVAYVLRDGGLKTYPLVIQNPGSGDAKLSLNLTQAGRAPTWARMRETSVTVPAGGRAIVHLEAEIAPSRDAFDELRRLQIDVVDAKTPFLVRTIPVALDFRPARHE